MPPSERANEHRARSRRWGRISPLRGWQRGKEFRTAEYGGPLHQGDPLNLVQSGVESGSLLKARRRFEPSNKELGDGGLGEDAFRHGEGAATLLLWSGPVCAG